MGLLLLVTLLFLTKHLVVDFFLQGPDEYETKGEYGAWGGIKHALKHGWASLFILVLFNPLLALILAILEVLIHYHLDWAKVQICQRNNWQPTNSRYYWDVLGVDQFLHMLTYVGMIVALVMI